VRCETGAQLQGNFKAGIAPGNKAEAFYFRMLVKKANSGRLSHPVLDFWVEMQWPSDS
jgi:hypothetical protein